MRLVSVRESEDDRAATNAIEGQDKYINGWIRTLSAIRCRLAESICFCSDRLEGAFSIGLTFGCSEIDLERFFASGNQRSESEIKRSTFRTTPEQKNGTTIIMTSNMRC